MTTRGWPANLIGKAGGNAARVTEAVEAAVGKLPKVSGDAGQVYLDGQTAKVLDEAAKIAEKAGDSFVPVERVLMALCMVKSKAKEALSAGDVSAQRLNEAINDIRKGRTADSATAEEGYDALQEICPRSDRGGARRQDRPYHWPRRRKFAALCRC